MQKKLALFSRITSTGRYIPEVDGFRFLAIASVVLTHLTSRLQAVAAAPYVSGAQHDWLASATLYGHYGVELFFVISGFILGLPFAAHAFSGAAPVRLGKFYWRRVTRLEPPYVLSLLLFFLLQLRTNLGAIPALVKHLCASMVYLHVPIYGAMSPINQVSWSLEIEFQFYLLAPLLALLFAIRHRTARRAVFIFLMMAAILMQLLLLPRSARLEMSLLSFIQYFLTGFLLADLYLQPGGAAAPTHWKFDVAAVVVFAGLFIAWQNPVAARVFTPFLLAAFALNAYRGAFSRRFLAHPWVAAIGGMCYSIYLLHYQIIALVTKHTKSLAVTSHFWVNLLLQLAILTPILLLLCGTFFLMIEKPCMRPDWPRRLAQSLRDRLRAGRKPDEAGLNPRAW